MKIPIIKHIHLKLLSLGAALFLLSSVGFAQSVGEGYQAGSDDLRPGMAVSTQSAQDNSVIPTNSSNLERFVGVITTIDENLLSVRDEQSDVLVTKSGEAPTYASNLNGEVAEGDNLTASPIAGVLMKASASQGGVLAVARQDLVDTDTTEETIEQENGGTQTVQVGRIAVDVHAENVINQAIEPDQTFLLYVGETITGKPVGQVQVVVALVVLLVILIVEGSIIYGAIHSTIGALGRNPLSKSAVFRQLLQVSWLAMAILVFGLGTIYLILLI